MKRWVANRVASFFGARGYIITRCRFHEENPLDLRAILAEGIGRIGRDFNVVQIGANDGVTDDPVSDLVKSRGWTLLAVEPLEEPFAKLKRNYEAHANVRCVQCAVGREDGEAVLYTLKSENGAAGGDLLSSFSIDVLRKHWRRVPNLERRIITRSVRTLTLPSLLREFGIPRIEMLQIDTEGFDYEIVKMAFESGLFPPILAFEWTHLSKPDMWSCRCDLIKHGYRWLIVKGDVVAFRDSNGGGPDQVGAH